MRGKNIQLRTLGRAKGGLDVRRDTSNCDVSLREAPLKMSVCLFGQCPFGNDKVAQIGPKKVPQSARLSEGRGGAIVIWAMPS